MIVYKFGGTSVANVERMRMVLDIIMTDENPKIVVLSAMSGTTNLLREIAEYIKSENQSKAHELAIGILENYKQISNELADLNIPSEEIKNKISDIFNLIFSLIKIPYTTANEKIILAQGEILSSNIFYVLCKNQNVSTKLINALDFMRIDALGEPDYLTINSNAKAILEAEDETQIRITQGYICKNDRGEIDNLKRGGSDYTATILGSLLGAQEIQIWTDIDGIHNNDPRVVKETKPIETLSYREAAELSYFGAKILHPACVLPAEKAGVPIRLKCTMKPLANGTLISNKVSDRAITALAAKDNITAIKIYSHRMLMAYGFLRRVFEVFEKHQTPVDMITTSEVAVSLTIDNMAKISDIEEDLKDFGEVEIDQDHSIICIVGNALYKDKSYLKDIFDCLDDIPVRMVSMGGSNYNISILVKSKYKRESLVRLNALFN